jgi:hypothetical protein
MRRAQCFLLFLCVTLFGVGIHSAYSQTPPLSPPVIFDPFRLPADFGYDFNITRDDLSFENIPEKPEWANLKVGHIRFSYRGDKRRGDYDWRTYRINPEGKILGSQLLEIIQPMSPQQFKRFFEIQNKEGDLKKLYFEYIDEISSSSLKPALSLLALNRILDHEAMKMKFSPRVSRDRIDYVAY